MQRNPFLRWSILGLSLLLGALALDVRAEEPAPGAARTRESKETYTNPKGDLITVEKSGTATKNPDGSTTFQGSAKTSNTATGRSRTVESSGQVTPTETGRKWVRDRKVENSAGGSHSSHTEGTATRNADGTRSVTSRTDRQGTTPRGKSWSGSRSGSRTRPR